MLALAATGCEERSTPSLATIESIEPEVLEPGDRLRITGTGFVEGPAKISLIGRFDPMGLAPPRERGITLDATAASSTWIELLMTDRVIGKLAEEPVDFEGEIEVGFPTSLSVGSVRITARSAPVKIEIRPAGGGVVTAAKRQREAERFLLHLGLGLAGGERGDDLQVTDVIAESPADRAGIEVGDRLLAIDGNALAALTDLAGVDRSDTYELELISSQGTIREIAVSASSAVRLEPDELAAVLLTSLALGLFLAFVAPRRGRREGGVARGRDPLTKALAHAAVAVALLAGPAVAIATRSELGLAGVLLGANVAGVVGAALFGKGSAARRLVAALVHVLPVPLVMSLPGAFGSTVGVWSAVTGQHGPPLEWHAWSNPFALTSIIAATALLWPATQVSGAGSPLARVSAWIAALSGATAVTAYGLGGWNVPGFSPASVASEPALLLGGALIFALKAWIVVHAGRWFAEAGATERRADAGRQGARLAVGGVLVLGSTALALLWEWSAIPEDLRSAGQLSAAGFFVTLVTAFAMRKLWNAIPRRAS
jgi:hypothetical protein